MANCNDNMVASCLLGAVLFLALYLLFTSWCNGKKDNFELSSQTTRVLNDAMDSVYGSGSFSLEDDTVQDAAEGAALSFYNSFESEPSRIDKTRMYQDVVSSKYRVMEDC